MVEIFFLKMFGGIKRLAGKVVDPLRVSPYLFTYFQVLSVFFGLMISSKILFLFFNRSLMGSISLSDILESLLYGLRYDLSAAAICSGVSILFIFVSHRYFRMRDTFAVYMSLAVTSIVALFILIGDSIYFEEAQRHLGYEVGNFVTDPVSLANFIFSRYWFVIAVYSLTFLAMLVYSYYRFRPQINRRVEKKNRIFNSVVFPELQLLAITILSIILIRGGAQAFPLEPIHANYLGNSSKASIALNGLYNAVYYSVKPHAENHMKEPENFELSRLHKVLSEIYPGTFSPETASKVNSYNVVIIFLESWDAYHMKSYVGARDVTPHFDRLRKASLTTDFMMSGGTRTSEGLFASLCSFPNPLGQTIVKTTLEQHTYKCLPEILAGYGYRNYFFQGTAENLARTGDFVRKMGFHESYGQEHIKNPKYAENWFGVHDPDLYDFVIEKMGEITEPFVIGINTGTTHDLKLPPNVPSRFADNKKNVMNFADEAISGFLEKIKKNRKVFNRTIFIMLADHTSHAEVSNFKRYSIPFLIYAPGLVKPEKINVVASQRDVAPTILDLLNIPVPGSFAGKSLWQRKDNFHFADYYHNGTLGWIEKDILVEISLFSRDKPVCYAWQVDPDLSRPVLCPVYLESKIERAKYFTYYTQKLLFEGKTTGFKDELLKESLM